MQLCQIYCLSVRENVLKIVQIGEKDTKTVRGEEVPILYLVFKDVEEQCVKVVLWQ